MPGTLLSISSAATQEKRSAGVVHGSVVGVLGLWAHPPRGRGATHPHRDICPSSRTCTEAVELFIPIDSPLDRNVTVSHWDIGHAGWLVRAASAAYCVCRSIKDGAIRHKSALNPRESVGRRIGVSEVHRNHHISDARFDEG